MIELLAPIGLAALGALIVPVLIHLVRRSERKLVDFAALRWISERNRPRKQIRLHERLLLVLRLLMIAVLAVLLALPVWRGPDRTPVSEWVVVAEGIEPVRARAMVNLPSAEWHRLAPGFPALDEASAGTTTATASLIRELDAALPAKANLTLIVPGFLSGLDAARLQLNHEVRWKIVPTAFVAPSPLPATASLSISVRNDDAGAAELPVVRALVKAWQVAGVANTLDIASADSAIPPGSDVVFWLAGEPDAAALKWANNGGTLIASRGGKNTQSTILISDALRGGTAVLREQRQGQGRRLEFPAPLTTEAIPALGDADFAERLRRVLAPKTDVPDRARAEDFAPSLSGRHNAWPAEPLAPWLALMVALLFLAERWIATGPRRGAE